MKHKHLFSILALLCSLALTDCDKDDQDNLGSVSVLKNGQPFNATIVRAEPTAYAKNKAGISFRAVDGYHNELLVLHKVPTIVGNYPITLTYNSAPDDGLVGSRFLVSFDDQLYDSYHVLATDSTSFVEITSYNARKKEVEGRFQVTLWADYKTSLNAPDSLVFSEGTFKTKIR
jgi:hypothetical protein